MCQTTEPKHALITTDKEGVSPVPITGSSRHRRRCGSGSPWFIDLGIQSIKGVIIRDGYRIVAMISMSGKGNRTLRGRSAGVDVLNCTIRRWLRQLLRHWTHVSVPEGLDAGIVGVCIIILNIWIRRSTTLLVFGSMISKLWVRCLNSYRQMERQLRHLEIFIKHRWLLWIGKYNKTYHKSYITEQTTKKHMICLEIRTDKSGAERDEENIKN